MSAADDARRGAAAVIAALPAGTDLRWCRILIDGRSGAGKSTLADAVAREIEGAQVVRLDSFYPGWDGLAAGRETVVSHVLDPVAPRWQGWDWVTDTPTEWHELDPDRPMIIEGAGALSTESRARADLAVWVELDEDQRRVRALELRGDGELYRPHWQRWADQERDHIAEHRPHEIADLVLSGHAFDPCGGPLPA